MPTDGTVYRHTSSNQSRETVLVDLPPREDQTSHPTLVVCNANNVRICENNQDRPPELPNNHSANEQRGPAPPPKDTQQPVSSKGPFSQWKKAVGGRDRERSAPKGTHNPPNYGQRIQELEKLLRERDNHIYNLEGQLHHQQRQLQEGEMVKQELASIRQNLQLDDQDEPWVIVKKFGEINKKVDDIAIKFSKVLSKSNARRELNSFDLFAQLVANRKGERKIPFSTAYSIDPDEFTELGCRSLLNRLLKNTVLNQKLFHPEWDAQANALYYELFCRVRDNEAQVNVGRWRISTFKTIPSEIRGYCESMANSFCDNTLIPFCKVAYDPEICQAAIRSIFPDLVALLNLAYAWHYHTRSTLLMLDFEIIYCQPGSPYDNLSSRLEDSEAKLPAPDNILLTSQLGLMSRKAMGDGNWEGVCQTQAVVLGNGYFSGGKL
ncbi:unnamed protein product [Rhizoctonia solani]|uniref:Uncharacterized protein n=1 Tax=Rhizoctonia solani TaxID=456999 RepID=A0A8H3CUX1_9AGAM|nr:unnamed protein product [Rhizoctonia solani]